MGELSISELSKILFECRNFFIQFIDNIIGLSPKQLETIIETNA
jgi:hypothetical protein